MWFGPQRSVRVEFNEPGFVMCYFDPFQRYDENPDLPRRFPCTDVDSLVKAVMWVMED
jgi:hypothetical protein